MNRDIELQKLAKQIKRIRLEKNYSQEHLAELCDFDRTYISMLERAKRNPSYLNLLRLAKGLDTTINNLIGNK